MKRPLFFLVLIALVQVQQLKAQNSNPLKINFGVSNGIPTENTDGDPLGGGVKLQKNISGNNSWELNASLNPGISLNQSRFVIGADLQLERYLSERFALTLSGGFVHFSNKPFVYSFPSAPQSGTISVNTDQNLIPFKLGLKVFPAGQFYLAGAAGIGIDINGNSSFLLSATAGVKMSNRFDVGIKYENYTDFYKVDQIALRLAYRIF